MEFCPRCKNIVFPRNTKGKISLICHSCGHEIKKFGKGTYKVIEETNNKRTDIIIVDATSTSVKDEDLKYLNDLYGTDLEFEE